MIMNNAHRSRKPEFTSTARHQSSVLRPLGCANDRIDVDLKFRVRGEPLEFFVEHIQALLRDLIGTHIVDADLKMIESGAVQKFDACGSKQIAIGDQGRDAAVTANPLNNSIQVWVQKGFATAYGNDGSSKFRKAIYAPQNIDGCNRFREIVVLVAVSARQVAPADRHDMRHNRVSARFHGLRDNLSLTQMEPGCVKLRLSQQKVG